ncbi:MAG: DUF1697 domain-containing protein [Candidatus Sulfotelmatobacter sp.]
MMATYISMLRGINVGGRKRIKMDQLRESLEALSFDEVQTYIQSGNVVFKTRELSPVALSKRIEERILHDFGFSVSVVSRTADEMGEAIRNNPFLKQRRIDQEKLHVTFLSEAPAPSTLKKLLHLAALPDQSRCFGKEIYLYLPNGVSGSSLMKTPLDRVLSVVTTTPNWKAVNQLYEMCRDCR